ncbi:histidine kinase [Streptomyces europaeiscabiei]|uniref:histidine kinase n=1 Tax=Streptomyces europaeiscabiei TaxID=146819 RepID=UPI0038F6E27E
MAEVWARRLPLLGDVASAAVVLVAMVAVRLGSESGTDASLPVTIVLGVVIAGSLAARRRARWPGTWWARPGRPSRHCGWAPVR